MAAPPNVPLRFASVLGPGPSVYHLAKTVVNNVQLRYHPRVRQALRRADGFVTSNSDRAPRVPAGLGKDSVVIPDTGPPGGCRPPGTDRDLRTTFRIAWSGIHVSRKALPLVLRAVRMLPLDIDWHLDIIGEGPMTKRWQRLAGRLGLGPRCTWHGWLPRGEARQIVAGADVFAFLSLHEGMPAVVMEALAAGVPVVCLDICGQGDVVDQSCGLKIQARSVRHVVSDAADAFRRLASEPEWRGALATGARERVRQVSWSAKIERMDRVYRQAILRHGPSNGPPSNPAAGDR